MATNGDDVTMNVDGQLAQHPAVRGGIDLLTAWLESRLAYRALPGVSIAIVHDQTLVWARGFGYADVASRAPATEQTLYRIASITKLFTASLIMMLRDDGMLRLDDPVALYLPWLTLRKRFRDAPPMTVRQLLTHTSGLPREGAFAYWHSAEFPSLAEIRAELPTQEPAVLPDSKWKYSNLGMALAGAIIEVITGQPYAAVVQSRILDPLGMNSTLVAAPPTDHPSLATGYGRRLPGQPKRAHSPYTDANGLTAAFNMTSSVYDMARFVMWHFADGVANGRRVMAEATARDMRRLHWLNDNWQSGWGLGFSVTRSGQHEYVGHGGAVLGYRTVVSMRPSDKVGVIVFANADDAQPEAIAARAFRWVGPALARATAPPEVTPVPPEWAQYVGRYRSAWRDEQVLIYDGQLILIDPTLPDPLAAVAYLHPEGTHTFRRHEPYHGGGRHGELMRFEMDDTGHVVRVHYGGHVTFPVVQW